MKSLEDDSDFNHESHACYLNTMLEKVPSYLQFFDSMRMHLLFFIVSSMDILHSRDLHSFLSKEKIAQISSWINSLAIYPTSPQTKVSGYSGYPTLVNKSSPYFTSNIVITYCALCNLVIIRDDFEAVPRATIIASLKQLQLGNGCFKASHFEATFDLRFLYCAAAISHILDDWSGFDCHAARKFILSCRNYDGAFGQCPGLESHGGPTFCGVATLALLARRENGQEGCSLLGEGFDAKHYDDLVRWCVQRQDGVTGGFQGRPHKDSDSCYSFWIGASLHILNALDLIDSPANVDFVLSCQSSHLMGGFSKTLDSYTDLFHTFFSLSSLSFISNLHCLSSIFVPLNISQQSYSYLKTLHKKWSISP